ncbi:hypothetical protein EDC01DRAFT_782605 [Geopyxis carbonaria]|nr:hypothetical protein EDC01DRAFT_782605 [Geopyxis carbonaria]
MAPTSTCSPLPRPLALTHLSLTLLLSFTTIAAIIAHYTTPTATTATLQKYLPPLQGALVALLLLAMLADGLDALRRRRAAQDAEAPWEEEVVRWDPAEEMRTMPNVWTRPRRAPPREIPQYGPGDERPAAGAFPWRPL